MSKITVLFVFSIAIAICHCTKEEEPYNFDELYGLGVKSYYEEEWKESINYLQSSVSHHRGIIDARESCFHKCKDLETTVLPDYVDNEELSFFHRLNQHAVCRKKCMSDTLSLPEPREGYNYELEQSMKRGDAYNYIQMSLFKEGSIKEAAKHAATNYYLDHQNPSVRANIEYYQSRDDLSEDDIATLERKPYQDLYVKGQKLYSENKFEEMVEAFESSLKHFYTELEKCRRLCEGPMQLSNGRVLSDAISSSYLSVLECKQSCHITLGDFQKDEVTNFFGSYFHYIQYGYYKLDRLQEGVKALTTHQRIEPDNEIGRMNAAYYKRLPGVSTKDFIEREDAKPILDMLDEESKLLEVMHRLLSDTENETEELMTHETMDDVQLLEEDFINFPIVSSQESEGVAVKEMRNFTVVESPTDHEGVERVVVDGLLSEQECKDLLELTETCTEGDGYPTKSPHTRKEKFEGLNVLNAAKAAVRKEANFTQVKLYIDASKLAQKVVREQFDLQKYLYFSYTHLVCRTAKEGIQDDRKDHSHPVHADNCILDQEAGKCLKIPPAYTWRDYSAILYLNDDFEGGDFFFAHSPKDLTPQHLVKPKCGRMVGFSAGQENLHGVRAVTKGRRCAVALWFTLDPEHSETTFPEAETLLLGVQH